MEKPQVLQNEKASSYSAQFRKKLNVNYLYVIINCDKNFLQITTAKLLQITTKLYYKLQQLIYYKL